MTYLAIALLSAAALAAADQQGSITTPSVETGQPADIALRGTTWSVVALGELRPAEPAAGRSLRITFQPGGGLNGFDGCNALRGSYDADDGYLKVAALMGTLVACPIPDQLDRKFREALILTRQWRIEGRQLSLLDDTGSVLARLEAQSD